MLASKRQRPLRWSNSTITIAGCSCSCFRLSFVLTIALLVYLNVIHLNSRYLEETVAMAFGGLETSSSSSLSSALFQYETMSEQPTNRQKLPPIYWINLDVSVARRRAMQDMFLSLGLTLNGDTHRVSAMNINSTLDVWNRDQLIFHPNVTLEEQDGRPSNKKHMENIYEYQEAACLLSHLKAIRQAYRDGHSQVLILEDDALLSHNFLKQWKPYVDRAPLHWKILQFATNNPNVVKQGVHLLDHFISWQPYHWSTRAYIINRAGMQTLMDRAHSLSPDGAHDIWRFEQDPMVVADEVLYYVIGEAYTSTRLWVDSLSFGSTIQSKNAHSNLTSLIGEASNHNMMNYYIEEKIPKSLLILMNVRARDVEELTKEIQWIRQDNHAISQLHETCEWEINLVVTEPDLMEVFQQATQNFPSNIHFHAQVNPNPFNKFSYIRTLVEEMLEYDFVLFKDNDQRISGFPWRTFVQQKGNAIVSGPLRQSMEEALLYRHAYPKRQWFQFHAAEAWTEDWNTKWSSRLFAEVVPTEVPLLEMYFVLFDSKFANYFFDMILTPDFVHQTSAWGPDLVWCSAAKEWDPNRPSCHLVPVSSSHEDTRQIHKNTTTHKESGNEMVSKFKENPQFEKWMKVPEKWSLLIGGHLLWQIERRCRKLLKLRMIYPFELQECPPKINQMVAKDEFQNKNDLGINGNDADAHVLYQKMNTHAQDRLAPWLQQLNQRNTTPATGGIQNRTRVAELLEAVKNGRQVGPSGVTTRSQSTNDGDPNTQKKSLDAFQNRLAELKKARADRLALKEQATEGDATGDDEEAEDESARDDNADTDDDEQPEETAEEAYENVVDNEELEEAGEEADENTVDNDESGELVEEADENTDDDEEETEEPVEEGDDEEPDEPPDETTDIDDEPDEPAEAPTEME
jgi:GR25 family glycosyltransferase involved in LPS biosynthesis